MSTITKEVKVGSEEGQFFKYSLHTNNWELEDGKLLSCRVLR